MYANNDLQAVQLIPGGNFVTITSSSGNWTHQNSSSSGGRSSKVSRGGSASKGAAVPVHSTTPVGCDIAYIESSTGNLMTSSGSQAFARPTVPQSSVRAGQQTTGSQPQATGVLQVHGYQSSGQQSQPQQALQLQPAPSGPQVYKVTNGTRVVKAGQPYPNTTIVQTAVAVPTNPQQPQQQQVGVITLRPQSMVPPHHQAQHQQALQHQPQHLTHHVQGVTMGSSIQLTSSGTTQQQLQQQQGQPAKVMLLQQAPPTQSHVLVAQPQQQIIMQQQQQVHQQQQLHGKLQQRHTSTSAAFQAVTVRPTGPVGVGSATIRSLGSGPITVQTVYVPPPSATTAIRPAVRIPKLGTVATYNPVTGVRSATTTSTAGGAPLQLLPANLPATLVQQVQMANLLQQQHQQSGSGPAAGGLKAVLTLQPQVQGQIVQSVGPISSVVGNHAASLAANGGQHQQRQNTLILAGGPGGGSGLGGAVQPQAPPSHMGITVVGGSLQQPQQQVMHANQHVQVIASTGPAQLQQMPPQQMQQPQPQQQVVNITLADGTTATTVMDQATLTRMLSESSRGQAAKLQQQQQQQSQPPGQVPVGGPIQVQLQAQPQQQQQLLLQTSSQLASPGLLTVLGAGNSGAGGGGKGRSGGGGNGGLEHISSGLQAVHLTTGAPATVNGAAQVLIMSTSQVNGSAPGTSARGPPPPGLTQTTHIRTMQMIGQSTGLGNLQPPDIGPSPSRQSLQQQQQQPPEHKQQPHVQLLQFQQQNPITRRSSGRVIPGDSDAASGAGFLLESSSMTLAQLQTVGAQRVEQQVVQQQQQQQHQALQTQQRQLLHSMVEGLSVVDLGESMDQQQHLQQQHKQMHDSVLSQRLLPDVNSGRLDPAGGLLLSPKDASAAMTAAKMTSMGGGDATATVVGALGSSNGGNGSSREDLKAILVSIGQELARHGISVETAVTSGWLGVLTAMDVAVLADAYTDEERRLMMQQKTQMPSTPLLQQQQSAAPLTSGSRGAADGASQHLQATVVELGPGSGSGTECRSGSTGERGSAATAGMLNLTSSSARTSMSVAPSDDGASSASGGIGSGADIGASVPQLSSGGGCAGIVYDLSKFNSYPYGFLGAGMLSTLGGDVNSDVEKVPAGGLDADNNVDTAAMVEVFREKPWPLFGMSVMAEEVGLSAQPHLQRSRHPFPPLHASVLLGSPGCDSGGSGNTVTKIIDSASEYEARIPFQQSQHQHRQQQQPGPGAPRLPTPELQSLHMQGANSGKNEPNPSLSGHLVGSNGGSGMSKGYSSAPSRMLSAGDSGASGTAVSLDKEIESRFANLDLGCGFY